VVFGGKNQSFGECVQPFAKGLFRFLAMFGGVFGKIFPRGKGTSPVLQTGGGEAKFGQGVFLRFTSFA